MANINKIRLSGQTYNIEDSNAPKTVELTQAQYDALAVKDPNTFYIITDAQGADLSQYYTSAQTESAITQAVSGKQDTLVSGTNIKTINNESILGSGNIDIQGGGGKAIEAGRGITITTGETADTVSINLPISATTNGSILIGVSCSANRDKSFVGGQGSVGQGEGSFAFGQYCKAGQWSIAVGDHIEANIMPKTAAFGVFNKQNGGYYEPQSATTLFSVGNGTANNARHNAFEIRQNGDIYLTLDGQDVKLQDQLGGSSITVDTALDSGSTNPVENRVIYNKIDEVEQVTARALNELNETLSGKADSNSVYTKTEANVLLDEKLDVTAYTPTDLSNYYTKSQTSGASEISTALDDKVNYTTYSEFELTFNDFTASTEYALGNKVDNVYYEQFTGTTSSDINDIYGVLDNKVDNPTYSAYTASTQTALNGKLDTSSFNTYTAATNSRLSEDEEVTAAGLNAINDAFGGLKLMKISQTDYDNLQVKDQNTLYIVI